jgi:hypothetical protein
LKKRYPTAIVILLTALLAACTLATPAPTPTPVPTPAPTPTSPVDDGGSSDIYPYTFYYNAEGNFSLALPASWTAGPGQSTPIGSKVLLGPEPLDDANSAVIVADATKVSNEQAVKELCQACDPLPVLKDASLNGLNVKVVEISAAADAPAVEWWLAEKDGKRIIFSIHSLETFASLDAILQSFTFSKEVGKDSRYGPAAWAAQQAFAAEESVDPYQVVVSNIQPVEWPNACLGAADAGETCPEEVTPGFLGVLKFGDLQSEFHTNQSGSQVRLIPGAAIALRQTIAQQDQMDIQQIIIFRTEKTDWPDACLSLPEKDETCDLVITPGYSISLLIHGKKFDYHTDLSGKTYRPVP